MRRFLLVVTAAAAVGHAGCLSLTPVGPITKNMFPPAPPNPAGPGGADAAAKPMLPPAPPPTPPTLLVTPGEVGSGNAADAVRRLGQELDADTKAAEAMPAYAEVSYVSGGK